MCVSVCMSVCLSASVSVCMSVHVFCMAIIEKYLTDQHKKRKFYFHFLEDFSPYFGCVFCNYDELEYHGSRSIYVQ